LKIWVNKDPADCAFSISGANMPKEGMIGRKQNMKRQTKSEGKNT